MSLRGTVLEQLHKWYMDYKVYLFNNGAVDYGKIFVFLGSNAEVYRNKETQYKKAFLKNSSSTHRKHWTLKPDDLNPAPRTKCRKRANPKAVL